MIEKLNQTEKFVPFIEIDGNMQYGIVLLADHATNIVPSEYGTLGLPSSEFGRHIAYDIGIKELTEELASHLNVPAVLSNFSRLLIDPNRGEFDPTLVMQLSDGSVIPQNYPLSVAEKQKRLNKYYRPYDRAIGRMITKVEQQSRCSPMVISLHSFTPVWRGKTRPWHIGLLWDSDPRVFTPLIKELSSIENIIIGNNEPYDGALKGDTMYRHCTKKGIAHILIEIRQDLISDNEGVIRWCKYLSPALKKINQLSLIHMKQMFQSRCED